MQQHLAEQQPEPLAKVAEAEVVCWQEARGVLPALLQVQVQVQVPVPVRRLQHSPNVPECPISDFSITAKLE